ncbi:AGL139Wp [Eremothecium gossypii ATCC 10895]|uniref:AGL139Wp n=1 Tax=Eremothecium gossypii (strain ATCC 10895 / CBS 109.51 / FGSC 9923 / NRRL Y-1056) TaxID=284811 RepID=Q750S8_EREGS|nr:AGL139Wp [Eremothecium gossypii ATCC 10895]AAS54352.1 AGL139Wp [Eremothecium gossypii ATCC 10895]AEY98679.1 FAGL139Wp [Eremothecium gossypii FDAG1]
MSRNTRRGKGIRDQSQVEDVAYPTPSHLLSNVLKSLELSFDKDNGVLAGKHVRAAPDNAMLLNFRGKLEKLDEVLARIAIEDQEMVDMVRDARDTARKVEHSQPRTKETAGKKARYGGVERIGTGRGGKGDVASNIDEAAPRLGAHELGKRPAGNGSGAGEQVYAEDVARSASEEDVTAPQRRVGTKKRLLKPDHRDGGGMEPGSTAADSKSASSSRKKSKVDIERIENDPTVKNPNSEFVVSQTLPVAARQLGLFNEEGLESTGDAYLKNKYAVASYPANDLKDMLPGELPDMDFSKPKPTNQIQYSTFLSSIDNFFREFTEDDIKFLQTRHIIPQTLQIQKQYDPEVTPYIIPKLGHIYTDVWLKEDNNQNVANLSPPPVSDPSSVLPKKSASDINDDTLETESISCGPLVSRLLSAILKDDSGDSHTSKADQMDDSTVTFENKTEDIADTVGVKVEGANNTVGAAAGNKNNPSNNATAAGGHHGTNSVSAANNNVNIFEEIKLPTQSTSSLPQQQGWKAQDVSLDYTSFEERLKRELKYVGIYMSLPKDENGTDDPDWLNGREDDEISVELRELQNVLRQVTKRNEKRKAVLVPLVEKQLAWQEYISILDDLDKQVDQAYIKRIRVPKNKKKKHSASTPVANPNSTSQAAIQAAHQQAANSSLKSLLDKRQRWISNIGSLFDKPEKMKRIPKESVFRDLDQEEEEEEGDVFDGNDNNKDEEDMGGLQK